MKAQFKAFATSGVAVVGAAVIAAPSIMAAPPADVSVPANEAHSVSLAANALAIPGLGALEEMDFLTRLGQVLENTINSARGEEAPWKAPRPVVPADDVFDGALQVTEGLSASGLRLLASAVLGPLGLLQLTEGRAGLEAFIENTVDAPLWIADPLLYSLMNVIDPDFGGGAGGTLQTFRNNVWAITEAVNELLLDLLPGATTPEVGEYEGEWDLLERLQAVPKNIIGSASGEGDWAAPRYYAGPAADPLDGFLTISEGLTASALRVVAGLVLSPLRLLDLSDGVGGVIENFVDAPLWAADPLLYSLRDALPAVLGGGANGGFHTLRNNLWNVTEQVNDLIGDLLPSESILASRSSTNATEQVSKAPEAPAQTIVTTVVDETPVTQQPSIAANTLRGKASEVADKLTGGAPTLTIETESEPATKSLTGELDTTVEIKDSGDSKRDLIRTPIIKATPGQGTTEAEQTPTLRDEADGTASPVEADAASDDSAGDDDSTDDDE